MLTSALQWYYGPTDGRTPERTNSLKGMGRRILENKWIPIRVPGSSLLLPFRRGEVQKDEHPEEDNLLKNFEVKHRPRNSVSLMKKQRTRVERSSRIYGH